MLFDKKKLVIVNNYLLILLAFLLPFSTAAISIISGLILCIWVIENNYQAKIRAMIENKIALALLLFLAIQLIGIAWTNDISTGIYILKKEWKLLFLPILFTVVDKRYVKYALWAFIISLFIEVVISFMVYLEIIAPFKNITPYEPSPFMDHMAYTPILSLAVFSLAVLIFYDENISLPLKILLTVAAIIMACNVFVVPGKAGQVGFFVLMFVFFFCATRLSAVKSFLIALLIVVAAVFSFYQLNRQFKTNVDYAVSKVTDVIKGDYSQSSSGDRVIMLLVSKDVILDNLFFGVGTGDYLEEYNKYYDKKIDVENVYNNPHNMYLLVLLQVGLFGFVPFITIFYLQLQYATMSKSIYKPIMIGLPIFYLVMMLSDIYLLKHHVAMTFVLFSSLFFSNDNGRKILLPDDNL